MKSKLLKIIIMFIMLTFVYVTIVNALSLTVTMTPSSTTVPEGTEFTITFKVSNLDVGSNGINSLSGYLDYDKEIFQTVDSSSIEGLNLWKDVVYNPELKKLTVTQNGFTSKQEEVFQIAFKTKTDISGRQRSYII